MGGTSGTDLHELVAQALDHAQPHRLGEVLVLSDAVDKRAEREGHRGEPFANLAEDRPGGLELSKDKACMGVAHERHLCTTATGGEEVHASANPPNKPALEPPVL